MAKGVRPELAELARRLKDAVARAGGVTIVARRSGVEERTLARWQAGESEPSALGLSNVAQVCETSLSWIVSAEVSGMSDEMALLPKLTVRASAGSGAVVVSEEIDDIVAVSRAWLRRIGLSPRFARVMLADGDSMYPTISDGDLLLVDESIKQPGANGIYVLSFRDLILVKRVQLNRDGTLTLKSDNPQYDTEVVPIDEIAGLQILGRVRWYGRSA